MISKTTSGGAMTIVFPDWAPKPAPAETEVRDDGSMVTVKSKLSTWRVPRVWMDEHGQRPFHEMVIDLGQFEVVS